MTMVYMKTWCAEEVAWKVCTIHHAMTPSYTREIDVEDIARQAFHTHREQVFPTIHEDNDRYFPHHHFRESSYKVAV